MDDEMILMRIEQIKIQIDHDASIYKRLKRKNLNKIYHKKNQSKIIAGQRLIVLKKRQKSQRHLNNKINEISSTMKKLNDDYKNYQDELELLEKNLLINHIKYNPDVTSGLLIEETLSNIDILNLIAQHLGCLVTRLAITQNLNDVIKSKMIYFMSLYPYSLQEKLVINENLIKKIKYAIRTNDSDFLIIIYPYIKDVSILFKEYPSFRRNKYESYIPFYDIDKTMKYVGFDKEHYEDKITIKNIIIFMICSYSYCYDTTNLLKKVCRFVYEHEKMKGSFLYEVGNIIVIESELLFPDIYPILRIIHKKTGIIKNAYSLCTIIRNFNEIAYGW
jgi:hypothetical protein